MYGREYWARPSGDALLYEARLDKIDLMRSEEKIKSQDSTKKEGVPGVTRYPFQGPILNRIYANKASLSIGEIHLFSTLILN